MHPRPLDHRHCAPAAVIVFAVRWYFRFQLTLRDIEELLLERGVEVSYETIRCSYEKFGACFAHRIRATRRKPGSTWHVGKVFMTLRGQLWVLWRAVGEHGAALDILLQKRRDKAAAKRFFNRLLRSVLVSRRIITDQLRSYAAVKAEIGVRHVFGEAAARVRNRAESSQQPTRAFRILACLHPVSLKIRLQSIEWWPHLTMQWPMTINVTKLTYCNNEGA